jgi:alkanesulfonate monooxygenase SsuD/methylene tetrahydromethanopterin reductase-like flavin-dependent oxidoreductase (luciferase family)
MRPLEFGWYLPTHGDTTAYGLMDAQIPGSPELCDRVVQAAEKAGFEYLLIPVGSTCWEAWISGAFMAARSKTIKPLIAARPGYINPVLLAKMISTFDQMSGGRICINLIAGQNESEVEGEGVRGRENDIGFGMRLQVICRENEADAWEAADQLVRHATERQKQEMKTLYNKSEANLRVQRLAREHGDLLLPHLWTGITKVRPGAGIAVVGNPAQCADTLQQFIDAGCHSFCLSGYLHDEEAERFGRLIRPILAENNRGRWAA